MACARVTSLPVVIHAVLTALFAVSVLVVVALASVATALFLSLFPLLIHFQV